MRIEVRRGSGRILALKRIFGGVWAAHKGGIVANMVQVGAKSEAKID